MKGAVGIYSTTLLTSEPKFSFFGFIFQKLVAALADGD